MIYSTTARCLYEPGVKGLFNFLDLIQKTKFQYVNLAFGEIMDILDSSFDVKGFAAGFKEHGGKANFSHAPFYYPFIFNDGDGLDQKKMIDVGMEAAAACGCSDYVIHVGSTLFDNNHIDKEGTIRDNICYLEMFINKALDLGIKIAIENGTTQPTDDLERGIKEVSPDFETLIPICDYFRNKYGRESMGICFDTGHAHLAHLCLSKELKRVGDRLSVTHIHDNGGMNDAHMPVGRGNIDWDDFASGIKAIGYDKELSLELYFDSADYESAPGAFINQTCFDLVNIMA